MTHHTDNLTLEEAHDYVRDLGGRADFRARIHDALDAGMPLAKAVKMFGSVNQRARHRTYQAEHKQDLLVQSAVMRDDAGISKAQWEEATVVLDRSETHWAGIDMGTYTDYDEIRRVDDGRLVRRVARDWWMDGVGD